MVLTFKYKNISRGNGTESFSPSVPIIFQGNRSKYEFMALLDSGADISAIPKSMAELLGLDLSGKKEKAFGIGGEVPAVQTKVNIEISKGHEKYLFQIPVKVILDGYEFPPLIGREGFFDKFHITFKQSERRVALKYKEEHFY
ncbi:MAG: retropepsin-like domain-containing protein [Nanoarchaeota archaeon]|nr:retropepsin-like domain-containing protein [Nanoarchaeota archaeon]